MIGVLRIGVLRVISHVLQQVYEYLSVCALGRRCTYVPRILFCTVHKALNVFLADALIAPPWGSKVRINKYCK